MYVGKNKNENSPTLFIEWNEWMDKAVIYWEKCYHYKLLMQMYLNMFL